MDIHINELIIEEGFKERPLKELSFRDIDQEFILVKDEQTHGSAGKNNLYYCFIKPYEGLFFRLIGITDEEDNTITVDEDVAKAVDISYSQLANSIVSKIIENGDLISNQLIVNLTFDYYHNNDDYQDLMKTRDITWIDGKRTEGNPDLITCELNGEEKSLRIVRCEGDDLTAEDDNGSLVRISRP